MSPTAPPAELLTAEEIAAHFGTNPRTVRSWIRRGLPAVKAGRPPRWRIDLDKAAAWIARNARGNIGPRIAGLAKALEATEPANAHAGAPVTANASAAAGEPDPSAGSNGAVGSLTRHIDRLDRLLDGFTELLFTAKDFDPRLVQSLKAISTELRRLETHRLEMRKADAALMDRTDHLRILGTFARLVVDEIHAWARTTPDTVIDVLTAAGVALTARRVAKSLDVALMDKAEELRTRITESIEQARDLIE